MQYVFPSAACRVTANRARGSPRLLRPTQSPIVAGHCGGPPNAQSGQQRVNVIIGTNINTTRKWRSNSADRRMNERGRAVGTATFVGNRLC